jgi:hypothetical protein
MPRATTTTIDEEGGSGGKREMQSQKRKGSVKVAMKIGVDLGICRPAFTYRLSPK